MIGWIVTLVLAATLLVAVFHVSATVAWVVVLAAVAVGAALRSQAPTKRIARTGAFFRSVCPYCGKHTKPSAVICHHCGRAVVIQKQPPVN